MIFDVTRNIDNSIMESNNEHRYEGINKVFQHVGCNDTCKSKIIGKPENQYTIEGRFGNCDLKETLTMKVRFDISELDVTQISKRNTSRHDLCIYNRIVVLRACQDR